MPLMHWQLLRPALLRQPRMLQTRCRWRWPAWRLPYRCATVVGEGFGVLLQQLVQRSLRIPLVATSHTKTSLANALQANVARLCTVEEKCTSLESAHSQQSSDLQQQVADQVTVGRSGLAAWEPIGVAQATRRPDSADADADAVCIIKS
jgi:hypothetical protein